MRGIRSFKPKMAVGFVRNQLEVMRPSAARQGDPRAVRLNPIAVVDGVIAELFVF
jgi:hypothetical protein